MHKTHFLREKNDAPLDLLNYSPSSYTGSWFRVSAGQQTEQKKDTTCTLTVATGSCACVRVCARAIVC